MKCVLVVWNPIMPEIVFMWSDAEFKTHIAKTAMERGLVEEDEIHGDLDIGILAQFFSPIIASHVILSSEMNCPYSSITCEDDFLFVMKQFGQHLYITVNGDGQESEQFLHKKLLVFHRIIQFFFGPATEQMHRDSQRQRVALWDTLSLILNSWCDLYHTEQSFLLEAVETLEVNQTLNELCIGLLESVLLKFRSVGDKNAVHAMLVTGSKLLALFSSRNAAELHSSDVLLIINLARALYPAPNGPLRDAQEEAQSQQGGDSDHRQSAVFSDGEFMSAGEGANSDGSQYFSPANSHEDRSPLPSDDPGEERQQPPTPSGTSAHETEDDQAKIPPAQGPRKHSGQRSHVRGQGSRSGSEGSQTSGSWCDLAGGRGTDTASIPLIDCTPDRRVSEPPNSNTIWYTPVEDMKRYSTDLSHLTTQPPSDPTSNPSPRPSPSRLNLPRPVSYPSSSTHLSPTSPTSMSESRRRSKKEKGGSTEDAAQMTVFLQQTCPYTPHVLHIVRLLPGIVLVVVTEVNSQVATWVSNCSIRLSVLSAAISRGPEISEVLHKQSSVGKLDADLKQLGNAIKKSKVPGLTQAHTELSKQWTIAKGCGLTTSHGAMSSTANRLENIFNEMSKILKVIFQRCYISPKAALLRPPSRYLPVIQDVKASLEESLALYHSFLAVKAERNITMTYYLEDFPGLVHFIHVNRTTDHLIAPSINISCEAKQAETEKKVLQEKVWSMVERCHEQLQQGHVMETMQQGDFIFSYFLYFEDSGGLLIQNRGLPRNPKSPVPGILAGKFFREVVEHAFPNMVHPAVTCCELFCIHLSVVPMAMVAAHIRRLRTTLHTGDAITPINLLG